MRRNNNLQDNCSSELACFDYVLNDDLDALRAYLDEDGDPNLINTCGESLLGFACLHGKSACIEVLLNASADASYLNLRKRTAVGLALQYACDHQEDPDKLEPLALLMGYDVLLNGKSDVSSFGRNALHYACLYGDEAFALIILDLYPKLVNVKDKLGMTPLMLTNAEFPSNDIYRKNLELDFNVAEALIEAGAHLDEIDSYGYSALMRATSIGAMQTMTLLLANGASLADKNDSHFTMLSCVCDCKEQNRAEVLELLISEGLNINATDEDGFTIYDRKINNADKNLKLLFESYGSIRTNEMILNKYRRKPKTKNPINLNIETVLNFFRKPKTEKKNTNYNEPKKFRILNKTVRIRNYRENPEDYAPYKPYSEVTAVRESDNPQSKGQSAKKCES